MSAKWFLLAAIGLLAGCASPSAGRSADGTPEHAVAGAVIGDNADHGDAGTMAAISAAAGAAPMTTATGTGTAGAANPTAAN